MRETVPLILAGFIAGLGITWLSPSSKPSIGVDPASGTASARPEASTGLAGVRRGDVFANQLAREISPLDPPFLDRARDGAATRQEQRLAVDLIVAGFAPDRAEWINGRVQELRMQTLQAQSAARREGRPPPADIEAAVLRAELGDQDYERFLTARGVPASVHILGVLASSPAERAGLQQGDEVFAYDGQRVFNFQELNELTVVAKSGEPVVLDVRRDGQQLRVVVPRGPLGIRGGNDLRGPPPRLQR